MKKIKYSLLLFLNLITIFSFAQSRTISGLVTSADDGEPLIGVSVFCKGTNIGTSTDIDGRYLITLNEDNKMLTFSMIGMETVNIQVSNRKVLNLAMRPDAHSLEQIVVTGYSSQKKADLTGAVAVVNVDDMKKLAANNPMQALQGRAAGVNITSDGSPSGSGTTIRIRGIGTLNNNDPLYIIDGVPTKSGMHELNSADIESIQVLKDASASSIYGSRAGNGVIIITTKKGKSGKLSVNFDSYLSTSNYGKVVQMLNTEEFGQVQWQAMVNSGVDPNTNQIGYMYDYGYDENGNAVLNDIKVPTFIDARDGTNSMLSSDTNWFDEITRPGIAQSYNLSVSQGNEKATSYFSLGYYDNQGTIDKTNFSRFSARMNSDYKLLGDAVIIGENFTVNHTEEVSAPGGVLDLAIMSLPIMPLKTLDGDWGSVTSGMNDRDNPARILDANKNNPYSFWRSFGNAYIIIKPIKGLNIRSNFGIDYSNFYQRNLTTSFGGRLGSDLTSSKITQSHSLKWSWSNTATYDLEFDLNQFHWMVGTEMVSQSDYWFTTERREYELENPDYMWPSAGVGEMFSGGNATAYALSSFFGKVDYSYADKYLASATIRRDGSSRFGLNNRYASFPAFSLGWRINQEDFMENLKETVSDLKFRLGWGQTGNQEIDNYANRTIIIANYIGSTGAGINNGTAYDIDGNDGGMLPSGYQLIQRANDNIKWETTTQSNIGLDFGFLDQKIYGSIEAYLKQTNDILVKPPYLGAIGEGGDHWVNGASMENKGIELSIGYRGQTSYALNYDISANISGYRNKITALPESVVNNYGGNGTTDNILGRPIGSYYGYVADGLFQTQEEVDSHAEQTGKGLGRIRYKDLNNDMIIDEQDRDWLGDPHPELQFGFNLAFDYKGFDLNAFVQGIYGNEVNNTVKGFTDFWAVDQLGSNKGTRLLDAWSPTNTTSTIPAVSYLDMNNERRFSSYYIESGSYVKLRNLQLGYTIPAKTMKKINIDKLRFYVSGQNLLTLKSKNFTGLDPENPNLSYPISTTYIVGLNLSF